VHEYNVAINGTTKVKELLITQTLIIWLSNNKAIIMQYPLTLYGQKKKRSSLSDLTMMLKTILNDGLYIFYVNETMY
jgi:hypothetical protein